MPKRYYGIVDTGDKATLTRLGLPVGVVEVEWQGSIAVPSGEILESRCRHFMKWEILIKMNGR